MENKIQDRIDKMNVRKIDQTMTSATKEGIVPDDETKAFMNIARSNGKIWASGYDDLQKVEISTEHHPLIGIATYNPRMQTESSVLSGTAEKMLGSIKGDND